MPSSEEDYYSSRSDYDDEYSQGSDDIVRKIFGKNKLSAEEKEK